MNPAPRSTKSPKIAVSNAWVLRVSNTDTNPATYGIVVYGE